MKQQEIRELTALELQRTLNESQKELLNLRIQQRTGQIENTARIRHVRRLIAQLRTEATARKNATPTA